MLIKVNIISLFLVALFFSFLIAVINNPCDTEDSANCYWDASTAGNGKGTSFIDVGGHAFYLNP